MYFLSFPGAPLTSIQVAEQKSVNELIDEFKLIAAKAGSDNGYIDSAVHEIRQSDNP